MNLYEKWVADAVADGWHVGPIYPGHESVGRAARLNKDGWKALVYNRGDLGSSIAVWGPDGLAVEAGSVYSMDVLVAGLTRCHYCPRVDAPTRRISFAGRCCEKCHPKLLPVMEYPGWTN